MLIRHTLLYLPAQILGPALQFVAAVIWTHWLTPDAYGVFAYVLAAQELAWVSIVWWSQFMLRYLRGYDDPAARARYQGTENAVLLACGLAQAAAVLIALALLREPLGPKLVAMAILYSVARSALNHLGDRARAEERIGLFTLAQLAAPVAGFGLGLLLVERSGAEPSNAVAGLAVANALVLAAMWVRMRLGLRFAFDRGVLVKALGFGGPLLIGAALNWASPNGIRLIVEHADGPAALGLLSLGWGVGQRFAAVVAMAVTAAAFPLAVGHLHAGRRDAALGHISANATLLLGLLAPATAGLLLLAPDLAQVAVAPAFRAATVVILPIAALAGAVRNFRMHYSDQAFLLFEQSAPTVAIALVEAVATTVLCWVGLKIDGLPGAALGALGGALIGAIYSFALCIARNPLPTPVGRFARILIATALMSAALAATPWGALTLAIWPRIAAETLAGVLVYALALGVLNPDLTREGFALARGRPLPSRAGRKPMIES